MADVKNPKNHIQICMFDQYGTVVDMRGGLPPRGVAAGQGVADGLIPSVTSS